MEKECEKVINPNEFGSLLFDGKEKAAVSEVLSERYIFRYAKTTESKVDVAEKMISNIIGTKYCLCVSSGTSALKCALATLNLKNTDRVLVSSYTFLASALAVKTLGAIPVPIDIDLETGLDLEEVKNEINKGCKAIIVVHLQGHCYNLTELKKIANDNNVVLIEDVCQAFGTKFKNKYAGTWGEFGVFSFQQYKQISTGEGGCLVTNNLKLYNLARNYSDMGSNRKIFPSWDTEDCLIGENYRMDNIKGAILIEQLKKFKYMLEKQYEQRKYILSKVNLKDLYSSSYENDDTSSNLTILCENKEKADNLIDFAKTQNIEVRRLWKTTYYNNELFKKEKLIPNELGVKDCDKTMQIIDRLVMISLPPVLNKEDLELIVSMLIESKKRNYIN
ncbi:MAG: aminotransferase class V-fold PLP-dependent enzyme [Oscillospiraceae bacterium]|nr:aminotransferase class V-fold PLP-dependent enzyme [Oscillospiraceae bacterium]